jgi:hypothetical protein
MAMFSFTIVVRQNGEVLPDGHGGGRKMEVGRWQMADGREQSKN